MSATLEFKVFCMEAYRAAHGLTGREVASLFAKYGVLQYLGKFYDTLHCESMPYIVSDIDRFIQARNA